MRTRKGERQKEADGAREGEEAGEVRGMKREQGREGQQHRYKLAKPRPWTCLINLGVLKNFFLSY